VDKEIIFVGSYSKTEFSHSFPWTFFSKYCIQEENGVKAWSCNPAFTPFRYPGLGFTTNSLGLASPLGSCELVTVSSDGFAVNA
jgi:hypothetical protein